MIRESLCLQQFSGDIDLGTLADLTAALDRILGQRPACVVLDMGGVDFVSVSGVGVIGRFVADAAAQQMPVSVVCERGLARTLRLCRLDPIVEAYATLEEAVEALQPHLLH
ncbi:STAS domain-containing protein [Gordonia sp. ABSL1-1]|uniref:STAS domain-containing protein n=1 Tax=Gordonia sp. ABSL1-1 TaxID=3053923 RepID=UPI0025742AE9|nr:STAS domain-containing protein [Gordonia sp. ABSL1-1]MDL9935266.1 STAS domain-containing protein [Gordonia sp. ABSL1-1]